MNGFLFLDTEFTRLGHSQLISIALVKDPDTWFYGELNDFDRASCSDFVRAEMLPLLGRTPSAVAGNALEVGRAAMRWIDGLGQPYLKVVTDFLGDWQYLDALLLGALDPDGRISTGRTVLSPLICDPVSHPTGMQEWLAYFEADPVRRRPHHALHDAQALRRAYLAALRSRR